jgi:hypothetical protein
MKKLLIILSFILVSNVEAQVQSFQDQVKEIVVGRDKYKIAVKHVYSGGTIYIPMRKTFNGKVLREWVSHQEAFRSRSQAMNIIKNWMEEEEEEKRLRRVEYIRIR